MKTQKQTFSIHWLDNSGQTITKSKTDRQAKILILVVVSFIVACALLAGPCVSQF